MTRILIVIPARFYSSRLPGKPLVKIAGVTMIERVAMLANEAAEKISARYADIEAQQIIASEDRRITQFCTDLGMQALLTSDEAQSGTDRCHMVLQQLEKSSSAKPDFVINLQGDAPFTPPRYLVELVHGFLSNPKSDVITPVERLNWKALDDLRAHKRKAPFSGTSCIRHEDGRAIWFSKQIIPAIRNEEKLRGDVLNMKPVESPVWRHVGLYGYRTEALEAFTRWPLGYYEKFEGLEQLRFLENGRTIQTVELEVKPRISMSGIDTMEDVKLAEKLIKKLGDPHHDKIFC